MLENTNQVELNKINNYNNNNYYYYHHHHL